MILALARTLLQAAGLSSTTMRDDFDHQLLLERFLTSQSDQDFEPLFVSLYPRLRRFFLLHGVPRDVCEELVQDVLLIVYRRAHTVRDRALFMGWAFKVARNRLIRQVQQDRRDAPLEATSAAANTPAAPPGGQLEEWMCCLDESSRQIVLLRFVEDLSYVEIAQALDLPLGTVKWKLFDAKARLARYLKELEVVK